MIECFKYFTKGLYISLKSIIDFILLLLGVCLVFPFVWIIVFILSMYHLGKEGSLKDFNYPIESSTVAFFVSLIVFIICIATCIGEGLF